MIKGIVGSELITSAQTVNGSATFVHAMRAIALSHTGFNVANVLLFLPFTRVLAKALPRIMPDKVRKEEPHLKFIDVRMLDTPAISIQQSRNEIISMSQIVLEMLEELKVVIENKTNKRAMEEKIFRQEEELDVTQKEITEFLSSLLSGNVPHEVMNNGRIQLRMADEYESISDYITNILKLNLKMDKTNLHMTDEARKEILDLHNRVLTYVNFINDSVKEDNKEILREANKRSRGITHFVKEYRRKHLERVGTEYTSPLKSLIFTDMLNSYRRIKDHGLNVAVAEIETTERFKIHLFGQIKGKLLDQTF